MISWNQLSKKAASAENRTRSTCLEGRYVATTPQTLVLWNKGSTTEKIQFNSKETLLAAISKFVFEIACDNNGQSHF